MLDVDLLITILIMTLLVLRQIFILKQSNKINYAPLIVGIGAIGSILHFVIHPDATNVVLLFRESFLPLFVSLIFYIIMNILHQTQETQSSRMQEEFTKLITMQVSELKEFMGELEVKMIVSRAEDMKIQEDLQEKFKHDIKILDTIKINQTKFLAKFDEMEMWHKSVAGSFEDFTNVQLPELDNVVHKHIDILRVSEQDHYNKIKEVLAKAVDSRYGMTEDLDELKEKLSSMKSVSEHIAKDITTYTIEQLSDATKSFGGELISLKSHAQGVGASLYENENRLNTMREQSEMIMKQIELSSLHMNEIHEQNEGLRDFYITIKELVGEVEIIKSDYVKSQSQLGSIANELSLKQEYEIVNVKDKIEMLIDELTDKIDSSLDKLHEHYHIASEDITQSVQVLSKKAQLQKGYTE